MLNVNFKRELNKKRKKVVISMEMCLRNEVWPFLEMVHHSVRFFFFLSLSFTLIFMIFLAAFFFRWYSRAFCLSSSLVDIFIYTSIYIAYIFNVLLFFSFRCYCCYCYWLLFIFVFTVRAPSFQLCTHRHLIIIIYLIISFLLPKVRMHVECAIVCVCSRACVHMYEAGERKC